LRGGIPSSDVDALEHYWLVCSHLRKKLFSQNRPGYLDLAVAKEAIKPTIYGHGEFVTFMQSMEVLFNGWRQRSARKLRGLSVGFQPKALIKEVSEDLLTHYTGKLLIDKYDVYQHLMDYWASIMQDDCYLIAADGWKATTYRVIEVKKNKDGTPGKEVDKGWTCDLVPKSLIVARYFAAQQKAITNLEVKLESLTAQLDEMEEEQSGEEGAFAELEKVTFATVRARLKELAKEGGDLNHDEFQVISEYLDLCAQEAELKRALKEAETKLDALAYAKYPTLTEAEIKKLVVDDKWLAALDAAIHGEMDRISQSLSRRVKELAERYETSLPHQVKKVLDLEQVVNRHLQGMGFVW
jgi:type I restriction enzyme M protein